MLIWRRHMFSDEKAAFNVTGDLVTAGRGSACDIKLPSAFIADRALVFERQNDGWELQAIGINGCECFGRRLRHGDRVKLYDGAEVRLHPYVLKIDLANPTSSLPIQSEQLIDEEACDLIRSVHIQLLDTFGFDETDAARDLGAEYLLRLEHAVDEIACINRLLDPQRIAVLRRLAGHTVRNMLIDRIIGSTAAEDPFGSQRRQWVQMASAVDEREADLRHVVESVESTLGLSATQSIQDRMSCIDTQYWDLWRERVRLLPEFYGYLALREIKKQVKDILFGYGAIEDLLRLPTISEIMVVGHDQIFVEKRQNSGGTIENSGRRFVSSAATQAVIERIVSRCNRRIDQSQPMVDARLEDGSRVNAVIPPVSVCGPCLTIRKFPERSYRMANWIESGGITPMAAHFLESAVKGRKNILVIGGTGAGKTTLLNCLADWIPDRERIVTIEDTAELQLLHDHVVQLQTRPANADDRGAITTRDLVRNALRMRPDRVIVGECRGAEALDMLNAMNTGHEGSMTTLHANSPQDVSSRLESMIKTAVDFSESAIRQQIASAIDLVVQVAHSLDVKRGAKRRFVASIAEVRGVDPETARLDILDLFSIPSAAPDGNLRPTGRLPSFGATLAEQGLFDLSVFCPGNERGV